MTPDIIRAAAERLAERMERDARGMTHDDSEAGTAHWWTRQRYDDVHLLLTDRERLERELAEVKASMKYRHSLIGRTEARALAAEARSKALEEALTPSSHTKAAYIGEFSMGITLRHRGQEDYRRVPIEWTTIKEIMSAIRDRAGSTGSAE